VSEADVAVLKERLDMALLRLDEIKAMAQRTNGRVTKLEQWRLAMVVGLIVLAVGDADGLVTVLRMLGM